MAEVTPNADENPWKKLNVAIQDADTLRQEAVEAHTEHLITEIETLEGPLATTLRAVYDGEGVDYFMEKLDARIKGHDHEIERMCNYHYQGFIDSIRELQQVSGDATKLKGEIQGLNRELKFSCDPLLSKGDELVKYRKIQKNVTLAIESLSLCLPVLEMYGKLQEQMKCKRYYPALKTLEQLEHTYLPRVLNHWFSQTMAEAIPRLRERIKDASMVELKDFLESIRKHSAKIGEVAMRHAAEQNNMDPSIAKKRVKTRRAPPPPNPFTGEVEDVAPSPPTNNSDKEEELSAQDLIDFSPVYRCLHIYSLLGDKEKFESYYRSQRWKQAWLSLQPPPNMHESLDLFKKYFHDIIGFFVVEDHILHTTQGLVTRSHMDELWEKTVEKLSATLRITWEKQMESFQEKKTNNNQVAENNNLEEMEIEEKSCKLASLMLEVKKLIVLFCHTLKGYGFSVGRLLELLLEMRDRYSVILSDQWIDVFTDIFTEDNYTPILCDKPEDYVIICSQFPYTDKELDKSEYPRQFPFSQFVPSIYVQVKEYINACLKFSADLHLSHTEIDDMIRKSANQLLTKTLGACLSKLIKKPSLSLLQLIQISINMNYLEMSCEYLEEYISSLTGAEKDSVHIARLHGSSMFKDARSEAEQQIYQQLNLKIDEFLDLASYDWTISDSKGQASSYLMDLVVFLKSIFMSFTNLPVFHTSCSKYVEKVAKTACMSACQHIASRLMALMLDNEVKLLSMGAFHQFNLDVMQCEQFAASAPIPDSNDGTLQMAFTDLRQLLDLFINWDWSVYLADYGKQQSRYLRVPRHIAVSLLEKLNNGDKKKNNLFASLKKNERDKKRLIETVLKQLKVLENGAA
ncbi:exocyst complex component 6B-like isoform X3 [Biomphalaria glabrata]|uniref:Exocyst complex component n=1 Tax=Biomphalaria glabrata TaxID=6526 RepID=A0A9W2YTD6_BIOGL|nr:exocyst complex component 6B-like isoform X3 [Biomphalaria glabrata]KAI8789097.1 exocyst complex component 6B isoform X3 [Biomphalaria glabrata]